MKRVLTWILPFLLLAMAAMGEETHTVEYYYENYCESCDPEKDFAQDFSSFTGVNMENCHFVGYNTVTEEGQQALQAKMQALELEQVSLPMAIVDGKVYQGTNAFRGEMARDALSWGGGTNSTIVYLYTPACESCAEAEALIEALPESLQVTRGDVTFLSRIDVTRIDATQHPDLAQALFDQRGIPSEQRVTPAIFLTDKELIGIDRIERYLARYVEIGWAVGSVSIGDSTANTNAPAGIASALAAGLVAGLNGCALSMLLMFVSLLLESRRHAVPCAVVFLASKLACYLLIGFALTSLLQRLNPTWLLPAARWLLTILGGALAALNLWDALRASKGDLGGMKNQLPQGLRKRLHAAIRVLTGKKILLPACALLGILVAAGEFLCAGQLYLANLLQSVRYGQDRFVQSLSLIAYCVAFLAPSCILAALMFAGRSANAVADFMARHIALVKLLTAAMMLALILLSWIL